MKFGFPQIKSPRSHTMAEQESTPNDPRFAALLEKVCSTLPDEHGIREAVCTKFTKSWSSPRTKELGEVLGQPDISADTVRELLFFPGPADATLYTKLIQSPPDGSPKTHPQVRPSICRMLAFSGPCIGESGAEEKSALLDAILHTGMTLSVSSSPPPPPTT